MWTIFAKYDVTSEFLMLGRSVVLLLLMVIMHPKKNVMYKLTVSDFSVSALTVAVHQLLLYTTSVPVFNVAIFNLVYCLYVFLYVAILSHIWVYISFLSYERRRQKKQVVINAVVISLDLAY